MERRMPASLMPNVSRKRLKLLWDSELTVKEILKALFINRPQLQKLAVLYKLARRQGRLGTHVGRMSDEPDAEEQAAMAVRKAEIKASWTPEERAARCVGGRRKRCEIPHYRYDSNFAGFIGVSSLS